MEAVEKDTFLVSGGIVASYDVQGDAVSITLTPPTPENGINIDQAVAEVVDRMTPTLKRRPGGVASLSLARVAVAWSAPPGDVSRWDAGFQLKLHTPPAPLAQSDD